MAILGWKVQNDGGLCCQRAAIIPKAWGVFFRNLRQKGWKKLGFQRRLAILNRAVKPIILRALSAWAPTPHYVAELNKLQRRMVAKLTNLFMYPLETWRSFWSRAAKSVTRVIEGSAGGWWARSWITQAISWDTHIQRDWSQQCRYYDNSSLSACSVANFNTMLSWAPALAHFHDKSWVDARRVFSTSHGGTRVASRTGTRAAPGKVLERWHDRILYCRRMVA